LGSNMVWDEDAKLAVQSLTFATKWSTWDSTQLFYENHQEQAATPT